MRKNSITINFISVTLYFMLTPTPPNTLNRHSEKEERKITRWCDK